MKYSRFSVVLGLVFCIATVAIAASPVEKMLPAKNSVKGFSILADSLQYGKGNDIAKIYDGGYELYTKHGVIDAARQMYQNGSDYIEITIHTMKSPQAAMNFLKYWQKENKIKSLTKTGQSTGFIISKPDVSMHFVVGKYYTTITAFNSPDKAIKNVKTFSSVIIKRIAKG